jgi:homoserine dehydrogenase
VLETLPPGELRSPYYLHIQVDDRAGVLAHVAERLAAHGISVARLVQHQAESGADLHVVTHGAPAGAVDAALVDIGALPETHGAPTRLAVIASSEAGL